MATTEHVNEPAALWPASKERFERATGALPGGNSRTQQYVPPFPVYVKSGRGSTVVLEDGTEITDFLLNYTAAALGYGHPEIAEVAQRTIELGVPFGMPTAFEAEYAYALRERIPAMKRIRFTNSGSEATLHAIRGARAFTGRSAIAKAEGAYHGSHDLADYSIAKLSAAPLEPVAQTAGMPPALAQSVVLFPYNDLPGTLRALEERQDDIAAVILEIWVNLPGVIPGESAYLRGVQEWCKANDLLLLVDEVASFRTSFNGTYSDHGLEPDLVCVGKAIGGGFAAGAFGGREDVMSVFDPREPAHIKQYGTFNSHPVTMAAGLKTLEILDRKTVARMNEQGARLAEGIREIGADQGIPLTATSYGSVGNIHNREQPPTTPREAMPVVSPGMIRLFWALLERGFAVAPRGQFSTCVATTDKDVTGLLEAIEDCAAEALSTD